MHVLEGKLNGEGLRIGIAVGRFNRFITEELLNGAVDGLQRHGVAATDIQVAFCPGAFELPLLAKQFAERKDIDGVICLGAVIRGATSHYDLVCNEAAKGIAALSLQTNKPVIFGLVTSDTLEQAIERAGIKGGNKGFDAAVSVLEMCRVMKEVQHGK
ncbi:MAG: 6,7-dimethyl-8-ribityllumazine synthase [Veillonellaceae bacterium]|nr:6,7-dimethyl-8-ribityllumazine synthase [Veillonellaceae bacterium]